MAQVLDQMAGTLSAWEDPRPYRVGVLYFHEERDALDWLAYTRTVEGGARELERRP